MIRTIFLFAFVFNCFTIFSQKNVVNIDSIIKADSYTVFKNISYGPDKKNNLDLWMADPESKTPFVIYIHGGGFGAYVLVSGLYQYMYLSALRVLPPLLSVALALSVHVCAPGLCLSLQLALLWLTLYPCLEQ